MRQSKKMRLITVVMCVAVLLVTSSFVLAYSASGNWSAYKTVTLSSSDGWKQVGHSSLKGTNNDIATFRADNKTMYTDPDAKLVNSDGQNRSGIVNMALIDTNMTTDTNTGTKGYNYYSKIKPSGLQIGSDSIRYRIMAD